METNRRVRSAWSGSIPAVTEAPTRPLTLVSAQQQQKFRGGLFWKTFSGKETHTPPKKKQTLVLENYRPPAISPVYYKYDCAEFARLWRRTRSPSRVVSAAMCAQCLDCSAGASCAVSQPALLTCQSLRSDPSLDELPSRV